MIKLKTIVASVALISTFAFHQQADAKAKIEPMEFINDIVEWKKEKMQLDKDDQLLNYDFLKNAGTTAVDWYIVGLGRVGYPDLYENYRAILENVVTQKYTLPEKLSESKSTEWHRMTLAYLAAGGDATSVGHQKINLIQDGTYDRGKTKAIDAQGINGLIWGLITLDALKYEVPKDSFDDRQKLIERLLSKQLPDGGFSFEMDESDVDMTAMALQALAPYKNDEKKYNGQTVYDAITSALEFLKKEQTNSGAFKMGGEENLESTAQVVVAVTSLGLDPEKEFIKKGNSLIDGMLQFQLKDGGFIHSKKYNKDNPTALPDESNTMASEQALYAFVSIERENREMRSLYDFRDEQTSKVEQQIEELEKQIKKIDSEKTARQTYELYKDIPVLEHQYIDDYQQLKASLKKYKIKIDAIDVVHANYANGQKTMTPVKILNQQSNKMTTLSKQEVKRIHELPKEITTEQYVEVTTLINRLTADQKEEKEILLQRKKKIEKLQSEIQELNEEILNELYPFSKLTLKDEEKINQIYAQYKKLPQVDQKQILSAEDLEKSKTQMSTLKRQKILKYSVAAGILLLTIGFILLRKRKKAKELDE